MNMQIQLKLLEQDAFEFDKVLENYLPFLKTDFKASTEEHVRIITNPNGRGEQAFDQVAEHSMLSQDKLIKMWGWFHGTTGFSVMFRWESGRQDAYIILDTDNASKRAKSNQTAQIINFAEAIKQLKRESK